MLKKSFVLLLLGVFFVCVHSQGFNDFQFADPFNWQTRNLFPERIRDVEEVSGREREPLSPDYRDPATSSSDEKPVLKPKPQNPVNKAPSSSIIPGGIIDVDAGTSGLSGLGADFGLPTFGDGGARFPGSGLFGLGAGFFGGVDEFQPWWKGPHVCIEREESTDDEDESESSKSKNDTADSSSIPNLFSTAVSLSNCRQTANKYECVTKINNHGVVKTFTVRYKCCYGFARTKGSSGCDKQLELKPILETISDLGAKEFRNLVQSTGLENMLNEGNYTVFVPTDTSLNDFNERMNEFNNVDLKSDSQATYTNQDLVRGQIVDGFIDLTDYSNEDLIFSQNHNSSIRINTYPTQNFDQKLTTVNCARVNKSSNLATNGVAYLLDGVARPVTQTLQEIIRENKRLSSLRTILESTDSYKNLRADGHYTIFAPTDAAFEKLDAAAKQKILRGDSCAVNIIKHHVIGHTICSAAISGNVTTHNLDGEVLNLERTNDDELLLENKAKLIETDILGTNGVIHLIDAVLIPESAQRIFDVLKNENLTKFNELIERAGFVDGIDNLKNATVFAPSNEAFSDDRVKKYVEEIGDDKEKLKDLILYHTLPGQLQSCEMNNNAMLKTNDHDKELRLNLYSTSPLFVNVINRATINCARVVGFDEKSCGSVIHEVNKVLIPPTENLLELINKESKFSILSEILKDTKVEKVLQENNQSITFLAPTDETFAGIDEADLKTLKENKERANAVLENHVLTEVLCCSGVGPQSFGFSSLIPALSRQHHQVGRTGNHQIRIGRAVVTSCDNLATNGVLHTVNKVLFPQRNAAPSFGGFFLFDL